jgi:hypothetical protein
MVTSRILFTAAQKSELWERWKSGQSAAAISRALDRKNKIGVERIVVVHGGIVPARRRRALAALIPTRRASDSWDSQISGTMIQDGNRGGCHGPRYRGADGLHG